MPLKWGILLWCGACVLLACSRTAPITPRSFEVVLHAALPEGMALAGVRFWADGRELGMSDNAGKLRTSLEGVVGQQASIAAICPPGYLGSETPRSLPLRPFVSASGLQTALQLTLICKPEERMAALVVRARYGNHPLSLPVLVNGEAVGATDPDGTGHFLLRVAPSSDVRVALDATRIADAQPQKAMRAFEVDESQSILLFDQRFEPAPRLLRTKRSVSTPKHVPYRIE